MIKKSPSSDEVRKILHRLATDDDFREQMLGDPVSALKPYGVEVDPTQVPAVRTLPSKDQVGAISAQAANIDNPIDKLGLIMFLLK